MLFILNGQGVPSVAKIVQISAPAAAAARALEAARPEALAASTPASAQQAPRDAFALRAMVRDAARGTPVVVGIRGTCPYGIAACWGGADEALRSLEGVQYVDPIPDGDSSTATIYLEDDRLPALDHWSEQFRQMVHDTYVLRGVEVTLTGTIEARETCSCWPVKAGDLRLSSLPRPRREDPVGSGGRRPAGGEPGEASAYNTLTHSSQADRTQQLTVTGPLLQTEAGYRLKVRRFNSEPARPAAPGSAPATFYIALLPFRADTTTGSPVARGSRPWPVRWRGRGDDAGLSGGWAGVPGSAAAPGWLEWLRSAG